MILDDPWTAGPTAAELKVLERLGARRQALEAIAPGDEHQAHVLARLFATLDDMEETLCEGLVPLAGSRPDAAPDLAEGWQTLDELEVLLAEPDASTAAGAPTAAGVVPIRRPSRKPESARRPSLHTARHRKPPSRFRKAS